MNAERNITDFTRLQTLLPHDRPRVSEMFPRFPLRHPPWQMDSTIPPAQHHPLDRGLRPVSPDGRGPHRPRAHTTNVQTSMAARAQVPPAPGTGAVRDGRCRQRHCLPLRDRPRADRMRASISAIRRNMMTMSSEVEEGESAVINVVAYGRS